jgi:cytochrome c2
MWKSPRAILLAATVIAGAIGGAEAQDIEAGEKVFAKCKACHMVGENAKNRVGPVLNGIVGRAAATIEGFKYSPAMSKAGADSLVWDETSLAGYLHDPKDYLKGNKMAFAGLKKDEDVVNVIAYLASFDADGKPAVPGKQSAAPAPDATQTATAEPAAPSTETTGSVADGELGLGRAATPEEIAAWDTDVRPDGVGLPEGSGTVAHGMEIYDERCATCHGDFGEAIGRWPVLAGGQGTLQAERPEKTIGSYWPYLSTVFDYVHRAMPFGDARSLGNDDVYALTAYLLYLNDIVDDEEFELSKDNFTSIRLPNEENFFDDDREQEPFYADKSEPCMTDCKPGAAAITMHAAVLDVTPEDGGEENASGGGID